ncbi:MAG: 50S ribosomal protein L9 [Chloroflexota bacterium]
MKVILLESIYKHGVAGEIVDVAPGFARNYLIPRGIAKQASNEALEEHQALMAQAEARREEHENLLNSLARRIDGVELIFERRASPTGTLYGSVTTQDIADKLMEVTADDPLGAIDINRRRISQQAIRELGRSTIPVRIGTDISPELKVIVVREGELEEFLAAREEAGSDEYVDIVNMEIVRDNENALPEEDIPTAAELAEEQGEELDTDNRSELEQTLDEIVEEADAEEGETDE